MNIGKLHIPVPESVYHSAGDEGRQNREALHYLANRMFWLHVQGQGAATFLRSVDIPRERLAGSRDRVQRFKRLLASPQFGGELPVAPEPDAPVGPTQPGYRWVGRSQKSHLPQLVSD